MTFPLEPSPRLNMQYLEYKILDRVEDCRTAKCWIIRDPKANNQVIWLKKKYLNHMYNRKGRLVLIKRLLYYFEYDASPSQIIRNYCGEKYCVNPAHCYVLGVPKDNDKIHNQIDREILTVEDARYWGLFNGSD